jgi:GT2 family glycosyltransferase
MALRAALDDPEIAVAGGIVMKMREDVIDSAGIAIGPNLAAWSLEEYCLPSDVGLLPGFRREVVGVSPAFLMVRRADHLRVGGFWEDLWAYGDEGDYALRMRRLGKAVVCADSTERHWVGGSTGEHQSPLRLYLSSRNRLLNIARHLPNTHLLQGIVLAAGFDILQILQQRNHAATGAVIRGWLAGARGFLRARARGSTDERCEDLKHIASLRAAIAQQRALGRLSI